ncbi:DUF455 family protein [Verrucosispora sp. NA02020]|uniref:DUF455 family protein n=1 Tax=Verrucosispora sp. NA02020 TaxID=2742132 RepID=UPI0015915B5C|nr:DUF455 family protein [Verrucosispora sp. NA02020]QKW13677.1 DUF455 family protein [Verrucosispora sp. NA02020]
MDPEFVPQGLDLSQNRRALATIRDAMEQTMGLAASVLVRIPATDQKLALSREIWALAQGAQLIDERIGTLRTRTSDGVTPDTAQVRLLNRLTRMSDPGRQRTALVGVCYPDLRDQVFQHRSRLLSAADETTVACLTDVLHRIDVLPYEPTLRQDVLSRLPTGPVADTPCPPLPEIPARPGREPDLREGRAVPPDGPGRYGTILYDMAYRIELCATEVCAAVLAHHPEAPWGLRYDLAKQIRDEARHFELFMQRAHECGLAPGDQPVQYEVWDKFALGRDLAERLIIEQRIGEGAALDSAENVHRRLKADGEDHIAMVFEYITADEVTHVANGNRWLRHLLGSEEAVQEAEERVYRLLEANDAGAPYKHPINTDARRLSGFSPAELARLRRRTGDGEH